MVRFSERIGLLTSAPVLEREAMPASLRNFFWQVCFVELESMYHANIRAQYGTKYNKTRLFDDICLYILKTSTDNLSDSKLLNTKYLKDNFYKLKWHLVYEFAEIIYNNHNDKSKFEDRLNHFLEIEKSAFRMKAGEFIPVISEVELKEINDALDCADVFVGAREHIRRSVSCFSQKPQPDYANTIKEAISAVESACRIVTQSPKATLGDALKMMKRNDQMHPSLIEGLSKLYGYTSDEGGIRHAMVELPSISESDARFMLVVCSAFVNYIAAQDSD